jgi:hypothetical protein
MSGRRQKWTACRIKKVHFDFWSAMQHCTSLQKDDPSAPIYIYKCNFCDGMHVTRGRSTRADKKVRYGLSRNLRTMSNPDFWYKADPSVINSVIDLEIKFLKHALGIELMNNNHLFGDYFDEASISDWND